MLTNTRRSSARRGLVLAAFAGLVLVACAEEKPQSTVSPGLDSGVTSQNGGGTRALGNTLNEGVTTRSAPVR